jgi:dihydrofolate synthase/folylpolyglutamate synthase
MRAMNSMDYSAARSYLFSHLDHSRTHLETIAAENFNLERVHSLLERLGRPHHRQPIVHIAGTKGKGSTAAIAASILKHAGYRTGLYSSPHLQDYRERFQINGAMITKKQFADQMEQLVEPVSQDPALTMFEIEAALAFLWFALEGVDAAVIEVGMGGRLDATNVVNPAVTVIAPISYDHMAVLGSTLGAIAIEKAGILKTDVPLVMAPQPLEAQQAIEDAARSLSVPILRQGKHFQVLNRRQTLSAQEIKIDTHGHFAHLDRLGWQKLALIGPHQAENAANAAVACALLERVGLTIPQSAFSDGLSQVNWPGRLDLIAHQPTVMVDSAHNADSARRVIEALELQELRRPNVLVLAALRDKDIRGMLAYLGPWADHMIVARGSHVRSFSEHELVQLANHSGYEAIPCSRLSDAFEKSLEFANADGTVLITGSLTTAGAAKAWWQARVKSLQL